ERGLELLDRGQQRDRGEGGRDVHGGGVDVVGGLREVHVVVGVQVPVVPALVAQELQRPVGDDLVGVHVGAGPGTALDDVDDELLVQGAVGDLRAGGLDGVGTGGIEQAEFAVGPGGGLLDQGERADQVRVR